MLEGRLEETERVLEAARRAALASVADCSRFDRSSAACVY